MISRILFFHVRPRIEHLILHVTSRCNLNCRTCFVHKEGVDLPWEYIREAGRTLKSLSWLDIGGGEPFLRDDLPQICSTIVAGDITISTNGQDPARVEKIAKEIRASCKCELTIAVSLDGFEDVHDEIRGRGSFSNALETIKRLTALKGLNTKVNTVVCRRNFPELLPFLKFVRSLEPQYHSLLLLRGRPADPGYELPSIDELGARKEDILAILKTYPYHKNPWLAWIGRNYHRLLWKLSLKALSEKHQPIPCLAGRAHLVIYANADVAPCELLPPVGNLSKASLIDICRCKNMLSSLERIRQGSCYCTHNCNMVENILFNLRLYPSLLGVMTHA